jgi:hypothetical protein
MGGFLETDYFYHAKFHAPMKYLVLKFATGGRAAENGDLGFLGPPPARGTFAMGNPCPIVQSLRQQVERAFRHETETRQGSLPGFL